MHIPPSTTSDNGTLSVTEWNRVDRTIFHENVRICLFWCDSVRSLSVLINFIRDSVSVSKSFYIWWRWCSEHNMFRVPQFWLAKIERLSPYHFAKKIRAVVPIMALTQRFIWSLLFLWSHRSLFFSQPIDRPIVWATYFRV